MVEALGKTRLIEAETCAAKVEALKGLVGNKKGQASFDETWTPISAQFVQWARKELAEEAE